MTRFDCLRNKLNSNRFPLYFLLLLFVLFKAFLEYPFPMATAIARLLYLIFAAATRSPRYEAKLEIFASALALDKLSGSADTDFAGFSVSFSSCNPRILERVHIQQISWLRRELNGPSSVRAPSFN